MSSLQSYYPSSKITAVGRLTLSFTAIPPPSLEKGLGYLYYNTPSSFVSTNTPLDQKTSIMALNQQGASWLNKIQVWKILEDEKDTMTRSGAIFLSHAFSQLNGCVSAVGLVFRGALSSWEIVLKLGSVGYNLIHYHLLWFKVELIVFLLYIFLCSMQLDSPKQAPIYPWKQKMLCLWILL